MKKMLLAGTFLAAFPVTGAWAACTVVAPVPGYNLTQFQCDSDNQATDGDDLKLFLDKETGVTDIGGSLNKNSSITLNQNIHINTDAPVNQEANGFAELHSANAGDQSNTLRDVTFTPVADTLVLPDNTPFLGFDGFFGRGQIDAIGGAWDGVVTLHIVFATGSGLAPLDLTFMGDTQHDDIGSIGFDEPSGTGALVASVSMQLDSTGAWNEVKQFDFSVAGATPFIPEPSTWAMMLIGFAGLGVASYRSSRKTSAFAA
jgi:hypothetical protein